MKIYPIIVTQERSLDTTGVNKILESWFFDLMGIEITEAAVKKDRIMPVTHINIDTLIFYNDFLQYNRLDILIEDYHKEIRLSKGEKLYSFTTWLGFKLPPNYETPEFGVKLNEVVKFLNISDIDAH